ncbi:MAG: tRNA uracil 4-sulfurtransferase ThiI [Anaerolineae bacterium]
MGLLLLRYGEIGLKGQNRTYFFRKLRRNVRQCLKANRIEGRVWQDGQRIYLETGQVAAAVEAVRRVFGLVSLSPVEVVSAENDHPDLETIAGTAVEVARRAGLGDGRTFRASARRADKTFPHISPEIERYVGGAVAAATGAPVDLSEPEVEIGIEVQAGRALVFGETIPGPGGLPLGSQGKVVALLSSGIDSPVAAWLMMKRGCSVIPVHFTLGQQQAEQVNDIVEALNRHAYGWRLRPIYLSHEETVAPLLDKLRALRRERWGCLFCKRALLARAAEIAREHNASALVTGDSLGQVASQTLSNLEVISYGIEKPILRPLIGLDKTEIMDLARQIGTYEASIQASYACPFLPDRPLTQASMDKLHKLLDQMEGTETLLPSSENGGSERWGSNAK